MLYVSEWCANVDVFCFAALNNLPIRPNLIIVLHGCNSGTLFLYICLRIFHVMSLHMYVKCI